MRAYLRVEIAVAVLSLALGLFYLIAGLRMPSGGSMSAGGLGPGSLPMVVGIVMTIAAGLYLGRQVRLLHGAVPGNAAESSSKAALSWRRIRRSPVLMIGLIAGYLYLVPWVGFFTLTTIFLIAVFAIIGVLTWPLRVTISVAFVGSAYLLFDRVLGVAFPIGYSGL